MFFTSCMSAPTNPSTICFVPKLFYTTSKNKNKSRLHQFLKKILILKSFNLCPEPFQNKTTFLQKNEAKNKYEKKTDCGVLHCIPIIPKLEGFLI